MLTPDVVKQIYLHVLCVHCLCIAMPVLICSSAYFVTHNSCCHQFTPLLGELNEFVVMLLMTSSVPHIYDMLVDWQAQELSQVTRSSKLMARLANAQQESPGLQAQLSGSQSVEQTLQDELANLTAKLTAAQMSCQDLQQQLLGIAAQLAMSH